MRFKGPIHKEVEKGGERYIGRGRVLLGYAERMLELNPGLKHYTVRQVLGNGVKIFAQTGFGMRRIRIQVTPEAPQENLFSHIWSFIPRVGTIYNDFPGAYNGLASPPGPVYGDISRLDKTGWTAPYFDVGGEYIRADGVNIGTVMAGGVDGPEATNPEASRLVDNGAQVFATGEAGVAHANNFDERIFLSIRGWANLFNYPHWHYPFEWPLASYNITPSKREVLHLGEVHISLNGDGSKDVLAPTDFRGIQGVGIWKASGTSTPWVFLILAGVYQEGDYPTWTSRYSNGHIIAKQWNADAGLMNVVPTAGWTEQTNNEDEPFFDLTRAQDYAAAGNTIAFAQEVSKWHNCGEVDLSSVNPDPDIFRTRWPFLVNQSGNRMVTLMQYGGNELSSSKWFVEFSLAFSEGLGATALGSIPTISCNTGVTMEEQMGISTYVTPGPTPPWENISDTGVSIGYSVRRPWVPPSASNTYRSSSSRSLSQNRTESLYFDYPEQPIAMGYREDELIKLTFEARNDKTWTETFTYNHSLTTQVVWHWTPVETREGYIVTSFNRSAKYTTQINAFGSATLRCSALGFSKTITYSQSSSHVDDYYNINPMKGAQTFWPGEVPCYLSSDLNYSLHNLGYSTSISYGTSYDRVHNVTESGTKFGEEFVLHYVNLNAGAIVYEVISRNEPFAQVHDEVNAYPSGSYSCPEYTAIPELDTTRALDWTYTRSYQTIAFLFRHGNVETYTGQDAMETLTIAANGVALYFVDKEPRWGALTIFPQWIATYKRIISADWDSDLDHACIAGYLNTKSQLDTPNWHYDSGEWTHVDTGEVVTEPPEQAAQVAKAFNSSDIGNLKAIFTLKTPGASGGTDIIYAPVKFIGVISD